MLAKLTLYDGTVYKIASKTIDTSEGLYLGRLKDELSLVSVMQEAGNAPATVSLTIINYDNSIPRNKDLWAAELILTNDNGISWKGKVNFCNFDADGNLYITASEKTAPELELQLPDEVRQVYTVDEDFHQSSVTMTIPLVIGGTHSNPIALPTILIDKTRGIYLVCVGEIREIVTVYNGAEALPRSAYTPYLGWSTQTEHPGFAYIQLEEPYRTNADGSYAEINVDVVGLKLGSYTAEECRNGARFLYYFLTTPSTGVNGWGCGISASEIDTASFNSAMILCDQFNFKLDGIMWLRQSASSWIDQICQAIHGKYSINANGKRSLFIDYAGNASKKTFNEKNMKVERYGKNSYTSVVYNKGILSYDYNPITGLFMQSAQYENAASIAQIGEQKFVGESYLLKDANTALAVLEYVCKRSQSAAEAIEFSTDDTATNLRAGDIITINRADLGINGNYQISSISTTDFQSQISAQKFDTSVFTVTGSTNTVDWSKERSITPALTPAQATNLVLSAGSDTNSDGTCLLYISGTFTVPDGGWIAAAVQYCESSTPSDWTELSLITEGRFKISPVKAGQIYSVRVRMITTTGHSDYITGQIRAEGDTVAPGIPNIVASTYLKTIRINITLPNPPSDLAGFEIYRSNISGEHGSKIGYISAVKGEGTYIDTTAANYLTNFYYSAKSIDKWGNASGYSSQAVANCSKIQAHEVEADWVISNLMETARGVGADVNGIKIDSSGIEGWYNGNRYIDLNSNGGSTIAGWNIGTNSLYNNNIELVSSGVARTMDFVSGHKGWQIDSNGKAEFQDATIRGTMTSVNFVKDTVSAVGGSLMILGAAEVQSFTKTTLNYQTLLTEDSLDLAAEDGSVLITEQSGTSVYYNIVVDDASTFNSGDILRIRNAETVQDLWLGQASKSGNTLSCVMLYGTAIDLESGMCIVNYRRAGNGGINLNGTSPSIDLYNHNGRPWAGTNLLARIGNLNGVNGITDDRYGFFFGNSDRSVTGRHYITWNETSNELEISGKLKAATGTFSGELIAASGSFAGRIEATSGKIGGFSLVNGFLDYESASLGLGEAVIRLHNSSGDDSMGFSAIDAKYTLAGPLITYNYTSGWVFTASMDGSFMCKLENSTTTESSAMSTQGLFTTEIVSSVTKRSLIATYQTGFNWYDATDSNNIKNLQLGANGYSFQNGNLNCYMSPTGFHQSGVNSQSVEFSLSGNAGSVITFNNVFGFNIFCKTSNKYATIDTNGNISASGTVTSLRGTCQGSSDENLKTRIRDVDVLDILRSLRIKKWNYKDDLDNAHIGPMAKDFNEAFDVNGRSSKLISFHDTAGIALRAIQELSEKVDRLEAKLCPNG